MKLNILHWTFAAGRKGGWYRRDFGIDPIPRDSGLVSLVQFLPNMSPSMNSFVILPLATHDNDHDETQQKRF